MKRRVVEALVTTKKVPLGARGNVYVSRGDDGT